jgi:large subunit ribosomal protein L24
MLNIRRDDIVKVISGKDKGKTGKVIRVFRGDQRVLVENINIVKKSQRKTQQNPTGGIIDIEIPIHASKVMLMDKKTNKPVRFGASTLKDGSKVRINRKTGEVI